MTVEDLLKFLKDKPKDTPILIYEEYEEVYHGIHHIIYDDKGDEIIIE
jgi:hypothetical protein